MPTLVTCTRPVEGSTSTCKARQGTAMQGKARQGIMYWACALLRDPLAPVRQGKASSDQGNASILLGTPDQEQGRETEHATRARMTGAGVIC
eukprot:1158573-Pelagomonas_calceolata.AAC.3